MIKSVSNGATFKDIGKRKAFRKENMMPHSSFILPFCVAVLCVLVHQVHNINASVVSVENGIYKRLTVRISEAVPRQLCHRAINNLQVGHNS